jgi:cytochrome P450
MRERPPVSDWASDFDPLDPAWINDPFPIWAALRKGCPVAHTDRFMGVYFPSRYADVRAIAYDTEHFSSRRVIVRETLPPRFPTEPITSDPPVHRAERRVLLPAFTPERVSRLEPRARALCNELIDRFINQPEVDAAIAYAQEIPARLTAHLLGLPEQDGELYRRFIAALLEDGITDRALLTAAVEESDRYFRQHVRARKAAPGDDLISYLKSAELDGQPLSEDKVVGFLRVLLVAGIDTTWSAIGVCLWHLAQTPADRERLVREPQLLPQAIEEFLRAYAPVTMARVVAKETQLGGCTLSPGQMVLLSFPAANRDPEVFPEPDQVRIDRTENRHATFGLGIHRCLGSNLARLELKVALGEFLRRIPRFHLAGEVSWSGGSIRGPRRLPLRLA